MCTRAWVCASVSPLILYKGTAWTRTKEQLNISTAAGSVSLCLCVGAYAFVCAHMPVEHYRCNSVFMCLCMQSPMCSEGKVWCTIRSSPMPLLWGHYYLKLIWCTSMYANPYTPIWSLEVDPDVWMPSGFVTVPLSDPRVQKQLESGIHLFLQWFTNTLYLHCHSSQIHASTSRYVDKKPPPEKQEAKRWKVHWFNCRDVKGQMLL